jgi:hypothetical protein
MLSLRLSLIAGFVFGGATLAMADDDPPSRVGRLSYTEGTVSFHTADDTDWVPATVNYPVTAGASFWADANSRAEIQIGPNEVRMDQQTELDIVRLDDDATQLHIGQGAVNLHVIAVPTHGLSVLTARGQVDVMTPGIYHIDGGMPNGDAPPDQIGLAVLQGQARFDGTHSAVTLEQGGGANFGGTPINAVLVDAQSTPIDDWAASREAAAAASQSARFVPPEMTGYQDLDRNGQWAPTPQYGNVWYPTTVAADWAPYHNGHWAFVAPWGWTWIDDAPWGFAPFHYGRWVQVDGRWGWAPVVPGVAVARPVYAPALVAFIGGGGFGVSLSVGPVAAVGWVPLAPFEPFHPWYHTSPAYVRNVNVMNVNKTVINNVTVVNNNITVNNYANRGAATVVPSQAFTHAGPVQQAAVVVPREQLAAVHVAPAETVVAFKPSAQARAGAPVALPAALVQKPGAPAASIAKEPVKEVELPEEKPAAAPHAPGPKVVANPAAKPGAPAAASKPAAAPAPAQAAAPKEEKPAAAPAPKEEKPAPAAAPAPAPKDVKPAAAPAPAAPAPKEEKPAQTAAPAPAPKDVKPAAAPAPAAPAPKEVKPAPAAAAPAPKEVKPAPAAAAPAPKEVKPAPAAAAPAPKEVKPAPAAAPAPKEAKPAPAAAAPAPKETKPAAAPAKEAKPGAKEEKKDEKDKKDDKKDQ